MQTLIGVARNADFAGWLSNPELVDRLRGALAQIQTEIGEAVDAVSCCVGLIEVCNQDHIGAVGAVSRDGVAELE